MMKTRLCLIFIVSIFLLVNCQTNEYTDPNYPTVVKALSGQALDQLLDQLEKTPFAEYTAVDTFGIPLLIANYEDSLNTMDWKFSTSQEALEKLTKDAIVEFGYFMNVTDSSKIKIRNISTTNNMKYDVFKETYPDSLPPVWKVTTMQQVYDGIEVRGSALTLVFSPFELVGCSGRWFSEIYIPDSFVYDEPEAKNLIMNKVLSYKNTEYTISEKTGWHNSAKLIVPIKRSDEIELRVCWALFPDNWEVIVDTQSGEILSSVNIAKL